MTTPHPTRNPKLPPTEMLAWMRREREPKNMAEALTNLELMGHYPDDPESRHYFDAVREKWGKPPLKLATEDEVPDFAMRTRVQVRNARELIYEDFDACVRMPWPALHDVIGHGLLPYQLWTIAAASGHGKTTFAMNLVKAWVEAGKRVYVVPLEQPTEVMRVYLAALTLGFPTKLALANRWREMRPDAQAAVESALVQQQDESELLHFCEADFLTVSGLPQVLADAQNFGADVVLIDHVHHILGEGGNRYAEFEKICQTLHRFIKDTRIPVVAMAQLHRGQVRDRLKLYRPPDIETIQMGDVLRQVSSVVLGLFRPLMEHITPFEIGKLRLGGPVRDFLKPATMAVAVLKSRITGDASDVVDLAYDRGHIRNPEPELGYQP